MKIAIAGYGIEGKANFNYWNTPENELTIVDERAQVEDLPEGAQTILGENAFGRLQGFDMVVRTAGLAPAKIQTDGKVWSATNEFFAKCPVPIVGVTGTKGKGTTCSLITSILRAAGKTVHLVGNIGMPALEVLSKLQPDDIVVYELSSFQLWDQKKSPHVAVVLAIEPDHLDIHADMEGYIAAKANIRRYQSFADVCLYHPTNELSRKIAETLPEGFDTNEHGASMDFAQRYGVKDDDQVYVKDGFFCIQDRTICTIDNLQLPGLHNLENACAAMSAVTELWLDVTDEQYAEGLRNFTGLPHRLKFVREVNNVKFYDDSIATTPGSAIAAIRSFEEPKVLILGGSDKGASYHEIVEECERTNTEVIAIGQTGEQIAELCSELGAVFTRELGDMAQIVETAFQSAEPGNVVILSPASASFDMFKSYSDRGDQFIAAVNNLVEKQ